MVKTIFDYAYENKLKEVIELASDEIRKYDDTLELVFIGGDKDINMKYTVEPKAVQVMTKNYRLIFEDGKGEISVLFGRPHQVPHRVGKIKGKIVKVDFGEEPTMSCGGLPGSKCRLERYVTVTIKCNEECPFREKRW